MTPLARAAFLIYVLTLHLWVVGILALHTHADCGLDAPPTSVLAPNAPEVAVRGRTVGEELAAELPGSDGVLQRASSLPPGVLVDRRREEPLPNPGPPRDAAAPGQGLEWSGEEGGRGQPRNQAVN